MTKPIQYCRCKINLAGQNCHTVILDEYNAVSWPEVQVLMALHGEENVMDIMPIGIGEVWPTHEKNRLVTVYGSRIVEQCFPGRAFRMDYMMTDQTDLPRYEDGKLVALESVGETRAEYENRLVAASGPKPEPKKEEPPKAPPSDPPGTDHDDGDDDEPVESAKSAGVLAPIFKPGRHKVPDHKGA